MIRQVCSELADFLCEKNQAYGNSALEPIGVFAKRADPLLLIDTRIDDKLNRLKNGKAYPGDNDVKDLCGYLILREVAVRLGGVRSNVREAAAIMKDCLVNTQYGLGISEEHIDHASFDNVGSQYEGRKGSVQAVPLGDLQPKVTTKDSVTQKLWAVRNEFDLPTARRILRKFSVDCTVDLHPSYYPDVEKLCVDILKHPRDIEALLPRVPPRPADPMMFPTTIDETGDIAVRRPVEEIDPNRTSVHTQVVPDTNLFAACWDNAPEWAVAHAVDLNGLGFWYSVVPTADIHNEEWCLPIDTLDADMQESNFITATTENWQDSLTLRPGFDPTAQTTGG